MAASELAATGVGRNRILCLTLAHRLLSPHRAPFDCAQGTRAFVPAKAHEGRIITDAPNVRWAAEGSASCHPKTAALCGLTKSSYPVSNHPGAVHAEPFS